jgi:trehalose 6-phosphate synthase/phosphatase
MRNKSRLILVSNRLPIKKSRVAGKNLFVESDGGLVSALNSYFTNPDYEDAFGEKVWIGAADFSEASWIRNASKKRQASSSYDIVPIFIEEKTFSKYYNGFCNATLWPLFHYFPSFAEFDENSFASYEEVNRIFKDKILEMARPGDTIWVHDYQLMMLPKMIRDERPDLHIGFFLHIPFPSYEVFILMHTSWKQKIVEGLLGADLIGFHTNEYLQHFLKTMRMVSGYDHRFREIVYGDRVVKTDVFPLGIDFQKFNSARNNPEIESHKHAITERFRDTKVIFSVDRLDYTKGVTHRLSGFERFLELNPEWRGKVVFIMTVVPSRQIVSKYNERRQMIEEQVGRINGKYSSIEWQPIIYRYSNLDFSELSALYQVAAVALITPIRDGMNLVAKEYVASRINSDGVLILGELAGAASELGEAMRVNPTDRSEVARNIFKALTMPVEQQQCDMRVMQERLKKHDVVRWVDSFFKELSATKSRQRADTVIPIDDSQRQNIVSMYRNAGRRLLFLDYDGTLAPIESLPGYARPQQNLLDVLSKLSSRDTTEVVIVSGRNYEVLEDWLGHLPIHLVAEHGASFKTRGGRWQHYIDLDSTWKDVVRVMLESCTDKSPGSFIEEKRYTIAWHYRTMAEAAGFVRSRELLDNLYNLCRNTHLNVLDGKKVIEVRAAGIDKGIATRKLMEMFSADFVFAIGDDKTDEDMFKVLNGASVTVKVGEEMTAARYRVFSQKEAFNLLDNLAGNE